MSIRISQKVTPLKCQRCDHIWNYKGKNKFVATCPHCRTYVTLSKSQFLSTSQDNGTDHVGKVTQKRRTR